MLALDILLIYKVVVIATMELAHSPVWNVVIPFILSNSYKPLIEIGILLANSLAFLSFGRRDQTGAECVGLRLNLHLSFCSLLFGEFLVHVLVNFLWTLGCCNVSTLRHLLSHHLGEGTVPSESFEHPFGLLFLFTIFGFFLSQLIDVGLGQETRLMRLPFDVVELLKRFSLHKNLGAICSENLESVVYFQPFVQD